MAIEFNGSNSQVTLQQEFSSLTEFTICLWIRSDVSNTVEQRVLEYNDDGIFLILSLNAGTANLIRAYCKALTGGGWSSTTSAYNVTLWNHVAVTAKQSDYLRLYVNGFAIGSPVAVGTFMELETDPARVLGRNRVETQAFDGRIDDRRMYNRACSAGEILTIANTLGHDGIIHGLLARNSFAEKHDGITASGSNSVVELVRGLNGTPSNSPIYRESILSLRRMTA